MESKTWQNEHCETIIRWAKGIDSIRLVLLQGSLASQGPTDIWSDIDICLFGDDGSYWTEPCPIPEFTVDTWVADGFSLLDCEIETRLLILERDRKIDFSFYPLAFLSHLQKPGPLPVDFDHGYQILLDKDHLGHSLLPPSYQAFQTTKPTAEQWEECQREFRFECWHVRKYVARGEWYHALWRLGEARQFLLQLMLWETASRNAQAVNAKPLGKNLSNILSAADQIVLRDSFPPADEDKILLAMRQMQAIFSKLYLN